MKVSHKINTVLLSLFVIAGLAACDKPGPAESAGKTIDQKMDAAGNKMEKMSNDVVDAVSKEGDKTTVAMEDAAITTKIKAAILAEPGLKTLQISVKTVKGVVTLSGSVDTQANSDMANGLSGAVAGVSSVNNNLVVKK